MSHNVNWYKDEADYLAMKEFCIDKDQFGPSYKEWCIVVEIKIKEVARQGITLTKKNIEPQSFIDWCVATSNIPNAKSRGLFASIANPQDIVQTTSPTQH